MTTKIKHRILIVRCKTLGCDVDLDYKSAGSGIGALAPIEPTEPYHVFMKSIEPDPGTLTCPECQQAHDYSNDDIEEKAIPEMEIGDTVTAWGQNALFELLSVKDGTA